MTPSELKQEVERAGHDRFFFTRKTMRFFGDTMRNYGVRDGGDCWELWRKRPVKHGLQGSAYFCIDIIADIEQSYSMNDVYGGTSWVDEQNVIVE